MKLITERGELVLPSDFSFVIEQNSPAFSTEGTQSIPVTLTASEDNFGLLSFPDRAGRVNKYIRKMPAWFESGVFQKKGQLVIDSAQRRKGITAALMINESDLYAQIKEITLPEVFGKIIRNDFSSVENWYNHIYSCMIGDTDDDFTAFPIAVNLVDGKYQLLNAPDTSSESYPWGLFWKARRMSYQSEAVNVPDGYGITPFLWLWRAIELLFAEFQYTVRFNPFKTDSLLKKIVLINNTADSICKATLNYADLVPSCTVADFIKWMEAKFLIHLYIYPESRQVDMIPFSQVINSSAQMDVSNQIEGYEVYNYNEHEEVDLSSDTSLEGSAPATDTILDLALKYPVITELNEDEFKNDAWKYSVILRKATGDYYEILRRVGDSSVKKVKLGSNYFRHFSSRFTARKYDAIDLIPAMVELKLGITGVKERAIICPFVGDSRHCNTSLKEGDKAADQKIIVALFAGESEEDAVTEAKYYIGTTQKYNNVGNQWSSRGLTTQDLYDLFWKEWNNLLMNSGVTITANIEYTQEQLLSLRMDAPVLLKGQKCLVKKISYSVGKNIKNGIGEYMLLRKLFPLSNDIQVSFQPQQYRWDYVSNAEDIFAEFDTQLWENYTWEYIGENAPSRAAFEFIVPPTESQYLSGQLFFQQSNEIRITAKKINETGYYYFDRVLTTAFRAALIHE